MEIEKKYGNNQLRNARILLIYVGRLLVKGIIHATLLVYFNMFLRYIRLINQNDSTFFVRQICTDIGHLDNVNRHFCIEQQLFRFRTHAYLLHGKLKDGLEYVNGVEQTEHMSSTIFTILKAYKILNSYNMTPIKKVMKSNNFLHSSSQYDF